MIVNSKDYWDNRFESGNWYNAGGERQSLFFSNLAISNFPEWLTKNIEFNNFSIVDVGCAQGAGTNLLKDSFKNSDVTGVDFSEHAVEYAKENYPNCNFKCESIDSLSSEYDVVFCSNVLEHFSDPLEKMHNLVSISKKYMILLVPFQEKNLHHEHLTRFDYDSFPQSIDNFGLYYFKVMETKHISGSLASTQQILLVYINNDHIEIDASNLEKAVIE